MYCNFAFDKPTRLSNESERKSFHSHYVCFFLPFRIHIEIIENDFFRVDIVHSDPISYFQRFFCLLPFLEVNTAVSHIIRLTFAIFENKLYRKLLKRFNRLNCLKTPNEDHLKCLLVGNSTPQLICIMCLCIYFYAPTQKVETCLNLQLYNTSSIHQLFMSSTGCGFYVLKLPLFYVGIWRASRFQCISKIDCPSRKIPKHLIKTTIDVILE